MVKFGDIAVFKKGSKDFFEISTSTLKRLKERILKSKRDLESDIFDDVLSYQEEAVKKKAIQYLTDYKLSDTKKRSKTIEDAFKYMEEVMSYEYNPSGSFTSFGAKEAYEKDVIVTKYNDYLSFKLKDKLAMLEDGINNWDNLRRLFFSESFKNLLYFIYPKDELDDFYKRLEFEVTRLKEAPRKYIFKAVDNQAEFLEYRIKGAIEKEFPGGKWS